MEAFHPRSPSGLLDSPTGQPQWGVSGRASTEVHRHEERCGNPGSGPREGYGTPEGPPGCRKGRATGPSPRRSGRAREGRPVARGCRAPDTFSTGRPLRAPQGPWRTPATAGRTAGWGPSPTPRSAGEGHPPAPAVPGGRRPEASRAVHGPLRAGGERGHGRASSAPRQTATAAAAAHNRLSGNFTVSPMRFNWKSQRNFLGVWFARRTRRPRVTRRTPRRGREMDQRKRKVSRALPRGALLIDQFRRGHGQDIDGPAKHQGGRVHARPLSPRHSGSIRAFNLS